MTWKGVGLTSEESQAVERIWPEFKAWLDDAGRREFEVEEFISWVNARPRLGAFCIKSKDPKPAARAANPGRVVIDAQYALYDLSGHRPKYTMQDEQSGSQVRLVEHVAKMRYRTL